MKRFLCFALAALLTLGAAAQRIRDIDILVEIDRDGSAWITQNWDVKVVSGTEWYIPIDHLGPMGVDQLSVSENGEAFENLGDNWDTDRSREWKTGKCGIIRKRDGVELCWGQGAYGDHRWTARFHVTGLVQSLDDADAFNFMFVNPGLVAAPDHARVTIVPAFDSVPWTKENTRVWAFGFYGEINVVDGKVVAESTESFSSNSKLIALVKFEKGMFEPAVYRGGEFQQMLDTALDGSSYGEEDEDWPLFILSILMGLFGFGTAMYALIATKLGYKWKKTIFGKTKIEGWYREAPLGGNLPAAWYALTKGRRFAATVPSQQLIGAYFLRWILDGHVTVMPDPKSDKRVNLLFKSETVSQDPVEEDLYQMARTASGENLLLEKNEFEKWSTKNYQKVMAWPDRVQTAGSLWLKDKGYFASPGKCTEEGALQMCHVVEFENFLKDFTISDQRTAVEVKLWKDYLVYAQLFGIAEKVAKQFQKLYPAEFTEFSESVGMNNAMLWHTMHYTNSMSGRAFTNAVNKAGSVSGGGGRSSFGGGGGFSGGGFGGGSR